MIREVLVGVVSGLRSQLGTAAVALTTDAAETSRPAALLASRRATALASLGALGELVGDKLPQTPSRLAPAGLVPRTLFGGLAAAALAGRGPGGPPPAVAAAMGAAGAVGGSFAGAWWRRTAHDRAGTDWPGAVAEDLLALALAWTVCRPARNGQKPSGARGA